MRGLFFVDPCAKGLRVIRDMGITGVVYVTSQMGIRYSLRKPSSLCSINAPATSYSTVFTRGTDNAYDDTELFISSADYLLNMCELICIYNQLHSNNVLTTEDHLAHIQMSGDSLTWKQLSLYIDLLFGRRRKPA